MNTNEYHKPSLDILEEFAENTGRKIEFTEKQYPYSVFAKSFPYKRTFYIANNDKEVCYYAGFSDGTRIGEHATYCGVFIPLELPNASKLKIRQKDILDKLNPFLKSNNFTTGNRRFDKQMIIEGNDDAEIYRLLRSRQVQSLIFGAFELKELVYVGINQLDVDFVPSLKNKSHFSVFVTGKSILEDSIIEKMFQMIEEFKNVNLIC